MEDLNENEITEIVIDFSGLDGSEEKLNELFGLSGYRKLGKDIEYILKRMFGMNSIPVTVRGTESQLSSFANALGAEKRYIQTARNLGLTDPRTSMTRSQVTSAAKEFKRKTGIDWPFK
jgi:hypothetical protein